MASETALDEGRETPEARPPGFSGRLLLRMPKTLHAELSRAAEREGTSLNQYIVGTLTRSLRDQGESAAADGEAATPAGGQPRLLGVALVVNLVVIVVAAAIAVALLIAAWNGGF